ncbi:MAG TPA: FAD-binding oxidoreductase, partial [Nitrososphaerales archaeon]|nr:FAD-binding oxidoreductase [Nitrososphaerales archaeon]
MRRISNEAELSELSRDSGIVTLVPRVAYSAETEEDVALGIREARAEGLTVTARGGGTSIPSQSVGSGAILLQARRRVEVLPDGTVKCEPGIVKADLNRVLSGAGRWMPVDPSSNASCTVGGMVANNSAGVRTMKYGSTIDFVRSLRAVVPGEPPAQLHSLPLDEALTADARTRRIASLIVENEKEIRQDQPKVTKNSSGYRLEKVVHSGIFDLPKLLVGSEGTLCV